MGQDAVDPQPAIAPDTPRRRLCELRPFLLRGGAERALGRPEAARASFAKAAQGGSPAFVAALSRLSARADRIPAAGSSPLQAEP